jgi:6-pyruvoyl-tetrahydropterin synthase
MSKQVSITRRLEFDAGHRIRAMAASAATSTATAIVWT